MRIQTPRGTHDILPADMPKWYRVESNAREIFGNAGFQEIRTPIFEDTELFERGVGEGTDIVNKEMYTFEKSDNRLTLRPENTAGVVRAYIEHGMDRWPKPVKLFYSGPMFRYERPQKGRQRQFNQIGIELFGLDSAQADAEVIMIALQLFDSLGLPNLSLDINNVGCFTCRADFRDQLVAVLTPYKAELCEDCRRRLETNPLRMLDCKNPSCQAIFAKPDVQAVITGETTCGECQSHFNTLLTLLDGLNIPYKRNPMLVRGLDYYTRTVFEIQSSDLGAQNTVCGGGRYNGLVKSLGGNDTPAVGWALGVERLVSLIQARINESLDYYVMSPSSTDALEMTQFLQKQGLSAECDLSDGKKAQKKQREYAIKRNAAYILTVNNGPKEVIRENLSNFEKKDYSYDEFYNEVLIEITLNKMAKTAESLNYSIEKLQRVSNFNSPAFENIKNLSDSLKFPHVENMKKLSDKLTQLDNSNEPKEPSD